MSNAARYRNDDLLDTEEVADVLGVCTKTVRNYIHDGKLVASRPGRGYLIRWGDVLRMLRENVVSK
jgi:excisionase family DNA binding protein